MKSTPSPVKSMFAPSLKPSLKPSLPHTTMAAIRSSSEARSTLRIQSIGSEMDLPSSVSLPQDPKDQEGVELLLGIANIVSKEIASSDKKLFDDGDDDGIHTRSERSFAKPSFIFDQILPPRQSTESPSSLIKDDAFAWHRVRTVSIDNGCGSPPRTPYIEEAMGSTTKSLSLPAIVSPVGTRLRTIRKPSLKLLAHKGKKEQIKFPKLTQKPNQNLPNIMSQHKRKAMEQHAIKGKPITMILRKKFSWKNYPGKLYPKIFHNVC